VKRLFLLMFGFVVLQGFSGASKYIPLLGAQKEAPPVIPPIKPVKVSEISANVFSAVYDFLKDLLEKSFEAFVSLKDFVETGEWFISSLKNPEMRALLGSFSLRFLIAFLAAFAVSRTLTVWLRPKINSFLYKGKAPSPYNKANLFVATLLCCVAPLVFGFLFYAIFRLLGPQTLVILEIIRMISSGAVTIWILLNVAHLFLKPASDDHKHIPLKRKTLASAYRWIRRMGIIALFGFFAMEVGYLINLPASGERLLLQGSTLIILVLAIFMMASLHDELKNYFRKELKKPKITPLKKAVLSYLGYIYIPLIALIMVSYMSWITRKIDPFQSIVWKTLLTVSVFPLLRIASFEVRKVRILVFEYYLRHHFRPLAFFIRHYGSQLDFSIILLLKLASFILILELWGWDPTYLLFSPIVKLLAQKSFSIFMIIFVALLITRVGNDFLKRYLNREKKSLDETKIQRLARYKTISSVSRNVLRIAVWTPAILLIIIELGVEIVPIIATVGILSIGLSFGVQSLIKDFVTGFFMLLEDAFAVGDLVVINDQMGRIESLTIRVVRLRASDGALYIYPYGSITTLCNQNRDYSAAVMLFKVGTEANIDEVFEIIEKISSDLRKDKGTKSLLVEPVEISGVNEVSDYAFEIRAILKTKPGQHFKVKWAFNRLLKKYLQEHKIPPAIPRQVSLEYRIEK